MQIVRESFPFVASNRPFSGAIAHCLSLRSANISDGSRPGGLKSTPNAKELTFGPKKWGRFHKENTSCQDPAPPPMESALMASGGLGRILRPQTPSGGWIF